MFKHIDRPGQIPEEKVFQPITDTDSFFDDEIKLINKVEPALVRAVRASQAHIYLGMNRHRFNQLVRPNLKIIPWGEKGAVYDRLDLDAWFEEYKGRNARPAGKPTQRGKKPWDEKERQDSTNVRVFGISTNKYKGNAYAKAQERIRLKKQNVT